MSVRRVGRWRPGWHRPVKFFRIQEANCTHVCPKYRFSTSSHRERIRGHIRRRLAQNTGSVGPASRSRARTLQRAAETCKESAGSKPRRPVAVPGCVLAHSRSDARLAGKYAARRQAATPGRVYGAHTSRTGCVRRAGASPSEGFLPAPTLPPATARRCHASPTSRSRPCGHLRHETSGSLALRVAVQGERAVRRAHDQARNAALQGEPRQADLSDIRATATNRQWVGVRDCPGRHAAQVNFVRHFLA